jgi:putative SOS response-associated peptidase YedK
MCNYAENRTEEQKLKARYDRKITRTRNETKQHNAIFLNGFGNPSMTVIAQENPKELDVFKWGLVPSHITNEKAAKEFCVKYSTLNAKAETIFQLPTYKKAIHSRRCLIAATAFFEWHHKTPGDKKTEKFPFRIFLRDQEIFSFGGIYENWKNEETQKEITTFSIVTTEANALMAKIHNSKKRMPLLFTKENEMNWINPDLNESNIKELMQPLDEKLMNAYGIKSVNTRAKDFDPFDPSIILPNKHEELSLVF